MTLEQLKEIVNYKFDVNIENRTRKRHVVYARKVYCNIAFNLNKYSLEKIGLAINQPHDAVLYHKNTIDKCYDLHKIGYNEIIKEYNLEINYLYIKPQTQIEIITTEGITNNLPNYILSHLNDYSNEELSELYKTRLEPFKKMLDNRVRQKEVKHIIGSKLIR